MDHSALLTDAFDRIQETVHSTLADLPADALTFRVDAKANTIAWLIWHLTRVQDDHVAGVAGTAQVWTSGGWVERLDLPFPVADIATGTPRTRWRRCGPAPTSCGGITMPYTTAPSITSSRSGRTTSTGSSTRTGIRQSLSVSG